MTAQDALIQKPYKLGIVGAGQVGSAIAYASLIRRSARVISLYDLNEKVARAQVEDLAHGTTFTESIVTGGGDMSVLADSQIIIITAGAAQKPGQTRLDLAGVNAQIISDMMPQLLEVCPNGIFVIITNPCDVLTVVAQQVTGLPTQRLFSTGTLLDTSRLRYLIAKHANISQTNVHATVAGEHGDSEFVVWSNATIAGVPIRDWQVNGERVFVDSLLDEIAHQVTHAAYSVIEGKGATNYAIGLSASYLVESLLATGRSAMPLSGVLNNYYGVSDVAASVPCLVSNKGLEQQIMVPMSAHEIEQLHNSAETMKETLEQIGYGVKKASNDCDDEEQPAS